MLCPRADFALALALVPALALASCTRASLEDAVVQRHEGRRIELASHLDVEIRAGTVAVLDRYYETMAEHFGASLDDRRTTVYLVEDAELAREHCTRNACYFGLDDVVIITPQNYDGSIFHELAHAFAYRTQMGSAPDLFQEGFAEFYGALPFEPCNDLPEESLSAGIRHVLDLPSGTKLDALEYQKGSRIVAYLDDSYGPEIVSAIFTDMNFGDDADAIDFVLERHTGRSLEQVLEDSRALGYWSRTPQRPDGSHEHNFASCPGPQLLPHPTQPATWVGEVKMDESSEWAQQTWFRASDETWHSTSHAAVSVGLPHQGRYRVRTDADHRARLRPRACSTTRPKRDRVDGADEYVLTGGHHCLVLRRWNPVNSLATVEIQFIGRDAS